MNNKEQLPPHIKYQDSGVSDFNKQSTTNEQ